MKLDYKTPNKVKIDMKSYCKEIIKEYPYTLNKNVNCPWNINLFDSKNNTKELDKRDAETFHTFVIKCMYVAKRGRPDMLTGISYLSTKVLKPYKEHMKKLTRIISYIKNSINICLTLEVDDTRKITW